MFGRYLLRRAAASLLVIVGVLLAVFVIARLTGDPVLLLMGPYSTQADVEARRHALGLDRPIYEQFGSFVLGALHGDMGQSITTRQPAMSLVAERLPATLQLAVSAILFALIVAVPAGVISAVRRNSWLDHLVMTVALLGQCIPVFWLGLVLILVLSIQLQVLPSSGTGSWQHLVMPTLALGAFSMARTARMVRSSMLEVLGQEYVRTAQAKGLTDWIVLQRHALRNAAIPVITIVGLDVGHLLGGAVITETIFAWPGLGRLIVQSISGRDFPVVQAGVLVIAVIYVLVNLFVDGLYAWVDPRIRHA